LLRAASDSALELESLLSRRRGGGTALRAAGDGTEPVEACAMHSMKV
jgi:hypothetical protein